MQRVKQFLPGLALLVSTLLYCLHFFVGAGHVKLITDSRAYLFMAGGGHLSAPYNSRVFGPFIASLIASALGVSVHSAFQILTSVALLASLFLLQRLISRQGGSVYWQAAVLLALGCAMAATFGYTPVMVDPLLLLLTCLTVLALDRGYFLVAVTSATLAALTKEYGLLLGLITAIVAYRQGRRALALAGAFLPAVALLVTTLSGSASSSAGLIDWQSFVSAMFGYHISLYRFRGGSEYPKLLYMWSWSVLWPVLVIAALVVYSRLRNRITKTKHEVGFLLMLVALPFLVLGDWGRSLLIVVPFACAVAAVHPLARNAKFAALFAVGGLSTALARPFHSESLPPPAFMVTMTIISVASSLLIGLRILRFARSASTSQLDLGLESPGHEVAVR